MRAVWNLSLALLWLASLLPAPTLANLQPQDIDARQTTDGLDIRNLDNIPINFQERAAALNGELVLLDTTSHATKATDATREDAQFSRDSHVNVAPKREVSDRPAGREEDPNLHLPRVRSSPPVTSAAPTIFGVNIFLIIIWLVLLYLMFRTGSISSTSDGTNYAEELELEKAVP